ncbi:MAG: hypothetical protein ACPGVO_20475 [Spirulinaceae cyanobacterium]
MQATVSDRLDGLQSDVQINQDRLQWFVLGGILLSLLFLLLPLGLQWRNEVQFQHLERQPTDEQESVEP